MRVFKPTYKDRNGRRRVTTAFYVEFRDQFLNTRRLIGFRDEGQTRKFGEKVEKLVSLKEKREPLDLELSRWVQTLPVKQRGKLAGWELIEPAGPVVVQGLPEHLDDLYK